MPLRVCGGVCISSLLITATDLNSTPLVVRGGILVARGGILVVRGGILVEVVF